MIRIDAKNLKNWLLSLVKALIINDCKLIRIGLIRINLRSLRLSILGSFRSSPKNNFSSCLGILTILLFSVSFVFADDISKVLDCPVVINLKRHPQRFEVTKGLMEAAGFTNIQRFDAIDGYSTDSSFFESLNIYSGGAGQKGCAASHLLVWKNFLESSDKEWLFVAEDDMLPHSDFAHLFPIYWDRTPKNFDIVMVGNQMDAHSSDPLVVSKPCFCMHAYIISKKGAEKLLKAYASIAKDDINRHIIDIFLISVMDRRLRMHPRFIYCCFNGTPFPDFKNQDSIFEDRDTGICFQNRTLGSSIHGPQIVPEPPKKRCDSQ